MEHQLSSKREAQKASCQPLMKEQKDHCPKITQNTHQQSLLGSKDCALTMPETQGVLHLAYHITMPDVVSCVLIWLNLTAGLRQMNYLWMKKWRLRKVE